MKKFGYKGLVRSSDFINGEQLAQAIGLVEGKPQHSNCDWLHFILNDQELLVPTKTFRYCVSWRDIYERGAVYSDTEGFGPNPGGGGFGVNQNCYITIEGSTYKVTLLKGANAENAVAVEGTENYGWKHASRYDPESTWSSEWNQLMYRLQQDDNRPEAPRNPSHPYGVWEEWTPTQINTVGDGGASWCQEKGSWSGSSQNRRVYRGGRGVSYVFCYYVDHSLSSIGWRPALRKT